jgi:RNA polymerase sigma factor (sigma-70 family)
MDDREILLEYVRNRGDEAFAELVRRHVDLVYSTALRLVSEAQLAKDISQSVFIHLARKAASVRDGNALPGWLYRATCYEAASAIRAEQRRRLREAEGMRFSEVDTSSLWTAVGPLLDEAMRKLGRVEQDAVVLRFFENMPLHEVGQRLGLTEEAARKRVSRALEKLRVHFERRGVKVASGALASALATHAVAATPASLTASLAKVSLASAAADATGLLSTLVHTLLMTKTAVAILTALVVGVVVMPWFLKDRRAPEPAEIAVNPSPTVSPAPQTIAPAAQTIPEATTPTMDTRKSLLFRVAQLPPLTPVQIDAYVEQNKRNAESLLAAFRISTNLAYLTEAAARFPTDPDVQYAVIASRAFPEAQRQWIDAYRISSPDNALAWYFSAVEHFKTGETGLALRDLAEATRKPAFRADLAPTLQAVEELNISAGRAADEAKMATFQTCCQVPHLLPMRELARAMQTTVQEYRQQGDVASCESLAVMGLVLGNHLSAGGGSQTVINQLVGMAIEKMFLSQLNPTAKDPFGRPVAEAQAAIEQHRATLASFARSLSALTASLDDAEWANYMERVKLYGEEAALTWLKAKHPMP